MRKWFEWQSQNQDVDEKIESIRIKNLHEETEIIRQFIDKGSFKKIDMNVFAMNFYMREIDQKYLDAGLTREQLRDWIEDPEYHKLMCETGLASFITVPRDVLTQFVSRVREFFPIDWNKAEIQLMVQGPGQMFPLHYDRFKSERFGVDASEESRVHRWIIMLDDQKMGQCFFMGDQSMSWKAGDVFSWEQTSLPHGSANFGYWPRYSIRITGPAIKDTPA